MNHIFQISLIHSVVIYDGEIFVDFKRRYYCSCGGRYNIRRKQKKVVRHSLLHNETLHIHLTITYYRCNNCKKYYTDDGGLGVQHQTTALYRKLAVELVVQTSLSFVSRLLKIPKSTLAGWKK